jgi:putative FmdB family regulatory protein
MPTYQYACTNADCGNQFELVQSFTDPAASECPVCGSRVRKVFSAVGVVFKGSGFYRTDSRAAAGKAAGDSPSTSSDSKESVSKSKDSSSSSSSSSSSDSSSGSSTPSGGSSGGSSSSPSTSGSGSSTSGKTAASA